MIRASMNFYPCNNSVVKYNRQQYIRQQGVALIYVMLIVAVITLMATEMLVQLRLNTDKSRVFIERTQARHYAMGAEQYVAALLEQDFQEDQKKQLLTDSLGEVWNVESPGFETEQGLIDIKVRDEQGLFNLNTLSTKNNSTPVSTLKNLISSQSLEPQVAIAVADWIDPDQNTSSGGAEDNYYFLGEEPYRTANNLIASLSELRSIRDITRQDLLALSPLLTALPESTAINVNTAPAAVLKAISPKLNDSNISAITTAREQEPLSTIADVTKIPGLGQKASLFQAVGITFSSQFFSSYIQARYRDSSFILKTLYHRNDKGEVKIVSREIGPDPYWSSEQKHTESQSES